MFAQYSFIDKKHVVSLQACVRNHSVITQQLLAKLYKVALFGLQEAEYGRQPQESPEQGIMISSISAGDMKIGTGTDDKTGFYIQLAKVKDVKGALLTVGAKWAMERPSALAGNLSTVHW